MLCLGGGGMLPAAMKILDVPRSGSYQGITSSRNRFGQYVRTRATPVNPASTAQGVVRARMSASAADWRGLTDNQRAGWETLGNQMQRTDALGQSYSLNGFQAFCSVNNVLDACGDARVSDAPALVTPEALLTATLTVTTTTASLAYTATPLPTGAKLMVFAAPQRSPGRTFEGDFRLIHVSAAAAASPANIFSAYQAKFGTPITGQKVAVSAVVALDGFQSGAILAADVVA